MRMQWGAGDTLMESDAVRKIGFTGSTRVGKMLFAAAAETVKKVCLPLSSLDYLLNPTL